MLVMHYGTKLNRQIVGIPMGTNCTPFVADLFLFCYERELMIYFSDDNQADVIEAFNLTSRFQDNLFRVLTILISKVRMYDQS